MRTRKRGEVTISFTFEGDYIPKEDIIDYLSYWIESGLQDRDDLVGYLLHFDPRITEERLPDE